MSGTFLATLLATADEQSAQQQEARDTAQLVTVTKGEWSLLGKQHENERNTKQTVSICGDPETEVTETGIESILEGFGLLSFKMEGACSSESDGQTMGDVQQRQPSIENDVARKQINLPQMVLRADQNIETREGKDTSANMPKPLVQDMATMPVQQGADVLEPAQQQGREDVPGLVETGAENATVSVQQNAGCIPETTDGKRAESALFHGVANALTDVYESAKSLDSAKGPPSTAAGVSPAIKEAYDLTDGGGQSGTEYRGTQAERQEQTSAPQMVGQQETAGFTPHAANWTTGSNTAIEATANNSLQQSLAAQTSEEDMTHNVMSIVKNITAQVQKDNSEMSVTLRPDFLGKLNIKLVMGENGIKAQLKTESAAVKEMMGEQIAALQETLKEKGIQVNQIEVAYEAPAFNQQKQYGGNNQQHNAHPSTVLRGFSPDGTANTANMEMLYESDLAIKNGSVEFRA